MTRSAAKRMNANARHIAANWTSAPFFAPYPFDETTARRYASACRRVDRERLDECNWPYAAELLNRMTR